MSITTALFSPSQSRLFRWLFVQPERRFHLSELRRLTGLGSASLQRELRKLTEAGLVTSEWVGNLRCFQANRQSPVFNELSPLTRKTLGIEPQLREALSGLQPRLCAAWIYGSVARQTDTAQSDIDVMLIGEDLALGEILQCLLPLEAEFGRKLNHYRLEAGRLKSRLEAAKHSKECPSLQRDVVFIIRFVRIDMTIDVGIDHLIGDVSTGRTEKSSAPKMPTPIPFANLWKFLLNLSRAAPFGHLHKVTDPNMRWNLRKNRDVIGRQNAIDHPNAHFFRHLRDDRANPQPQVALQDAVSIFRDSHQMITVVKNGVAAFAVLGQGGPIFEQAGILTRARTEVFPA